MARPFTNRSSEPIRSTTEGPPGAAAAEGVRGPPPAQTVTQVTVYFAAHDDVWLIDDETDQDEGHTFSAREKAVARARSLANENRALLVILDEDGTIEEQQDYGTMGVRPNPEEDVTGEKGVEATARAEERSMHRG